MLKLWTAALGASNPGELAQRVNRFRRQVEAADEDSHGDAAFVESVVYLLDDVRIFAFIDYYAEEELMPE